MIRSLHPGLLLMDGNPDWVSSLFEALSVYLNVCIFQPMDPLYALGQSRLSLKTLRLIQEKPQLWRWPLLLPPGWASKTSSLSRIFIEGAMRRMVQAWGSKSVVLVLTYPFYIPLARGIPKQLLVYYCFDHYQSYRGWDKRRIETCEMRLMRRADLILCTSITRFEAFRAQFPETSSRLFYLPNATGAEFLAPYPLREPMALPPDIGDLPRPILGCVGGITSQRLDLQLLMNLARAYPKASLLLIGDVEDRWRSPGYEAVQQLRALPNVHLIGWRPHRLLPSYIQSFDVCLIPFANSLFNRASCPLRMFDYLASTRPIVSTPLADGSLFAGEDIIHFANDPEAFIARVGLILRAGGDGLEERRWFIAQQHTWEERAKALWAVLAERLNERVASPGR